MGELLLDQFTLLHFSVGVLFYFWGVSFPLWILIHTLFEYIENTSYGIHIIQQYIKWWPGGKHKPDSLLNICGDTLGAILGWICSYLLDKIGTKYEWYPAHL